MRFRGRFAGVSTFALYFLVVRMSAFIALPDLADFSMITSSFTQEEGITLL